MTKTQLMIVMTDRYYQVVSTERKKSMNYTVKYEIAPANAETISDEMIVEAESAERAIEHATNLLEQRYDEATLLEISAE